MIAWNRIAFPKLIWSQHTFWYITRARGCQDVKPRETLSWELWQWIQSMTQSPCSDKSSGYWEVWSGMDLINIPVVSGAPVLCQKVRGHRGGGVPERLQECCAHRFLAVTSGQRRAFHSRYVVRQAFVYLRSKQGRITKLGWPWTAKSNRPQKRHLNSSRRWQPWLVGRIYSSFPAENEARNLTSLGSDMTPHKTPPTIRIITVFSQRGNWERPNTSHIIQLGQGPALFTHRADVT